MFPLLPLFMYLPGPGAMAAWLTLLFGSLGGYIWTNFF